MSSETRRLILMGYGFGIGSTLFALGAIMAVVQADVVATNVVYALGAVFFTSAAAVQMRAAESRKPDHRWASPDWMSAVIQLVGTLEFNIMTIRAVAMSTHNTVPYSAVWDPDVIGSAMFLISSWVAWHPIAREERHRLIHGRSALITLSNMLGSVFFAVSAWGAALLPDGAYQSLFWSNAGTFIGAVFFLIASVATVPRPAERENA